MPSLDQMENQFMETLVALGEYLNQMVMVGGWCPFLYSEYLWKINVPNILTTTDIDLGVKDAGTKYYKPTVYDVLKRCGYEVDKLYKDEEFPIEFISKKGNTELKIEFITSFYTSDDTLNRFLGRQLSCHRIEAFEILLENTVEIEVVYKKRKIKLNLPNPETFMFHKGISFAMRSAEFKRDKDLFYMYFILRYCPDQEELIKRFRKYENTEMWDSFQCNLSEYFDDFTKPGYGIIRKYLPPAEAIGSINEEIKSDIDKLRI